jgi:hypothetical protein
MDFNEVVATSEPMEDAGEEFCGSYLVRLSRLLSGSAHVALGNQERGLATLMKVQDEMNTFLSASTSESGFIRDASPEKAGVGGSIPSLATIFSTSYKPANHRLRSKTFQSRGGVGHSHLRNVGRIGLSSAQAGLTGVCKSPQLLLPPCRENSPEVPLLHRSQSTLALRQPQRGAAS